MSASHYISSTYLAFGIFPICFSPDPNSQPKGPPATAMPLSFLQLPAEIRNIIYGYALKGTYVPLKLLIPLQHPSRGCTVSDEKTEVFVVEDQDSGAIKPSSIAILRTCRQIYAEAFSIFVEDNRAVFAVRHYHPQEDPLYADARRLSRDNLCSIQDLHLVVGKSKHLGCLNDPASELLHALAYFARGRPCFERVVVDFKFAGCEFLTQFGENEWKRHQSYGRGFDTERSVEALLDRWQAQLDLRKHEISLALARLSVRQEFKIMLHDTLGRADSIFQWDHYPILKELAVAVTAATSWGCKDYALVSTEDEKLPEEDELKGCWTWVLQPPETKDSDLGKHKCDGPENSDPRWTDLE